MSSRQLKDLHPKLAVIASRFLDELGTAGLDILVTCTYRSCDEQDALYAQGRTAPGKIVTRASAGQSDHNFTLDGVPASKAFDIVPLRHGVPVWNSSAAEWATVGKVWTSFYDIRLGWGGRKGSPFPDMPHFYLKHVGGT